MQWLAPLWKGDCKCMSWCVAPWLKLRGFWIDKFTKILVVLIRREKLVVGGFQNKFFPDRSSLNGENTVLVLVFRAL